MKRFLFATLGGLLVALSIGLFAGSSASAASVYDGVIRPIDRIELAGCDITQNWVSIMENKIASTSHAGTRLSMDSYWESYNEAIFNDGQWSNVVARPAFSSQPYDSFIITHRQITDQTIDGYAQTGQDYAEWSIENGRRLAFVRPTTIQRTTQIGQVYGLRLYKQNLEGDCEDMSTWSVALVTSSNFQGGTFLGWANNDTHIDNVDIRVFLSTYEPNFPSGYQGEEIPDTWYPPVSFDPQHTWTVDRDGTLRVVYDKNYPGEARGNSYWELLDTSGDPVVELDTRLLTPYQTQQYTFELPGPGTYELSVGYTGDLPENWEDFNYSVWNSSIFSIKWDGASFISGNNHDRTECDFQVCYNHPRDPLGGAFGTLNPNMHGLQNVVLMPINFLATLPSYVDACQPISIPILGSSQELPCLGPQYASINGGFLYGLWQTVITATVTFGVAFQVFRIIKNVNSPKDDGIEMEKL